MTIKQILHQLMRYITSLYKDFKRDYPQLYRFTQTKEWFIVLIFWFLFFLLLIKIFSLQILSWNTYDTILQQTHTLFWKLEATRWNIYVHDASQQQPIKLTENVTLYNVFVDPAFVKDKSKFITTVTPLIYSHLCQMNGFDTVDKDQCIRNLETFAKEKYLPQLPIITYYGQGISSGNTDNFDYTGYNIAYQDILSGFTIEKIEEKITKTLDQMIVIWERKYNYLWYYSDRIFINNLKDLKQSHIYIYQNNYVFIEPKALNISQSKAIKDLETLLINHWYFKDSLRVKNLFESRKYRYVKLISWVNPSIIDEMNTLKQKYYKDKDPIDRIPLLHGLGTESFTKRYYPYGRFMSHIIGYIANNGEATYGIEEYFDDILRWRDGKIEGRSSSSIGQLWANDIKIENVKDWYDVYLTIDPVIQKQSEKIINKYRDAFRADSVSILVYDPFSWHVIASANAPDFDPNKYNDSYTIKPLSPEQWYIVDNETFLDFPVYVKIWGETRLATRWERIDTTIPKYVASNPLWPNLFVDKNIAYPYEPWSIFKTFTFGVWLDQNEIELYDWYEDRDSQVKVWPFTIKNAAVEACRGTHTFLHALQYSCNVGMVRIAQKLTQNTFYNYLEKLGFASMTNIELAWEDPWFVEWVGTVSVARFFNNVFGQGLLVTPMQIAAGYGAMLNGGTYIKPTILSKVCESGTTDCQDNDVKIIRQIFEPRIADQLKYALTKVIEIPENGKYADVSQYQVWWKSWTSQISYKWKYKGGNGWTNGSFVGIVTQDNMKYIVVVQVRRPRSTQRWNQTAWPIFRDMASFLVNYLTLKGEKFEVE
jgi:cell division protein FtsI/penicillin-binding protein 2